MRGALRDSSITVVAALSLSWLCFQTQRYLVATLLGASTLPEDLGVTAAGAGLLVAVYFPAYGLMQIPSGVLADLGSPRRNLIIASFGMIVSGLMFSLAPDFSVALVARLLVGVSSGLVYLSIIKLCANWFTGGGFGTAVGIVNAFGSVGTVLSFLVIPVVVVSLAWRTTSLLVVAALMLIPISMSMVRDRPESGLTSPRATCSSENRRPSLQQMTGEVRVIVGRKDFWFFSILSFMWIGFHFGVINWFPRYCLDVLALPKSLTGLLPAFMAVGGGLGNIVYGSGYDRWKGKGRLLLVGSDVAYVALLSGFVVSGPILAGNLLVLVVGGLALGWLAGSFPLVVAALREIVPLRLMGTGLGIYNGLSFIAGFVYPWLIGIALDLVDKPLSTTWTYSHTAYSTAFLGGCASLLLTLLATLLLTRERRPAPQPEV